MKYLRSTRAEQAFGTDSTPNQGRCGERIGGWAAETIFLRRSADIFDVVQHPVLDENDDEAADDGRNELDGEHHARWYFHVMAEFQVSSECDSLGRSDVTDYFEDHVGDGASGQDVAADELVHDLRWDLLVGDGLQHGDRDGQEPGDDDGDEGSPSRELSGEDRDGDHQEDERDDEHDGIPVPRHFGVGEHQARVHVAFVFQGASESSDDISAEPHC